DPGETRIASPAPLFSNRRQAHWLRITQLEKNNPVSFAPQALRQDESSRAPCWQDASDECHPKNPKRDERERAPRKREMNRPTKDRTSDHASEYHRKTKPRRPSNHASQHSEHRAFPEQ